MAPRYRAHQGASYVLRSFSHVRGLFFLPAKRPCDFGAFLRTSIMQKQHHAMSIPLPHVPGASNHFLDPEERYAIFEIKAAERPHLVGVEEEPPSEHDDDDNITYEPPLLDGCDIPTWRKEGLVGPLTDDLLGALRIGAGCSLFRRESQWPMIACTITRDDSSPWSKLREKLLIPPTEEPPRVDIKDVSQTTHGVTKFALEWEQRNVPVIIENCTRNWKAMPVYASQDDDGETSFWNGGGQGGWTFANLLKRFGNISWRFSDTHGEMMPLGTYAKYIVNPEGLTDDSPLAIYDSAFGDDDSPTHVLLNEYDSPPCFSADLFALTDSDSNRPPYRWVLIGPERSGTGLHVDPLFTNAWVTLLQGRKRWLLFPPETPPELIGMDAPTQIPSSIWFSKFYKTILKDDFPYKAVHVLQHAGETVFVPSQWPHLVVNLDLTVSVTHNYASEHGPFEDMWKEVVTEEPDFAANWFAGLQTHRPDLVERIQKVHPSTIPHRSSNKLP